MKQYKIFLISSIPWSSVFDIESKIKRLKELEIETQKPEFWKDHKKAVKKQQEISVLNSQLEFVKQMKKDIEDIQEISKVEESSNELLEKLEQIDKNIKNKTKEFVLSGKYDMNEAVLSVLSGAGGRDADDWATMIFEMYQKYCEKQKWPFKILSQSFGEGGGPDGRIGLKEGVMQVKVPFAYGLLKKETGVHRLVRISPFSSKKLRHTSFCNVDVLPRLEEVDFPKMKPDDLKIETFRATGHGGQNVNKRETAIRITHLPTGLTASSQEQRQQVQNKNSALSILAGRLFKLQQKEKQEEVKDIKGDKVSIDFGRQIRSFVLHPYKLVKDHRTKVETSNIEEVLDGGLDLFI
ncbi:MAG: peptide chain release factor 2 [Parcubacteria group bacterium]|nr:peptide chain release factor 2 [Parcubacteria group bacterium]